MKKISSFFSRHLFVWYWLCGSVGALIAAFTSQRDPLVPPVIHYLLSPLALGTAVISIVWFGTKLLQWMDRRGRGIDTTDNIG